MGLLTSVEIKAIRGKYNLTQNEFSKKLGLGDIGIHRYENNKPQTKAIDVLIRLSDDPEIFEKIKNITENIHGV